MSKTEKAWIRGFCTALAEMHRLLLGGCNSSGVRGVAKAAAVSLREAKQAGVPEYDLAELVKAGVQSSVE